MALLQWKEHYSVGIDAVDHEHKDLILLINKLHDVLGAGAGKPAIDAFLGDLLKGISAHFALEERFMREHGYDQLAEHKADHERLLDEIREIMDDYETNTEVASEQLGNRLDAWFSRHFETHDARLHKSLGQHSD